MTTKAQANEEYTRKAYAVWELTRKCNLACNHCGSRRGAKPVDLRIDELSTAESLELIDQLEDCGIEEVTLIGGEFFLKREWFRVAEAISRKGMICSVVTGGYGLTQKNARRLKDAGVALVSVSIDGMEQTHDMLRGTPGAWKYAFQTLSYVRELGIVPSCNSQVNRHNAGELTLLYEALREAGVQTWQIQITAPMGGAADHAEFLLQPAELLILYPIFASIFSYGRRDGLRVFAGDNLGYYGPYERLLRSFDGRSLWMGCQAGLGAVGIEANGAIKACLSLPTSAYVGGNLRQQSLAEIVENTEQLNINSNIGTDKATEHLWGFCRSCEHAELCRGGCSWMSHVFFGKRGNNPYCHHRVLKLASQGLRERVQLSHKASGKPFDHGLFELIEEPLDAPWPEGDNLRFVIERVQWPERWLSEYPDWSHWIPSEIERVLQAFCSINKKSSPTDKPNIIILQG